MTINIQTLKIIILTAFIMLSFLIIPIWGIGKVEAACVAGQPGPHSTTGNGGLTGRDCSSTPKNKEGTENGLVPGDYSLHHECASNVECKVYSWYCTPDNCEEKYSEPMDCGDSRVPAMCNRPFQPQSDIGKIFGEITAPGPIHSLGFGSLGISTFFSNLVKLAYSMSSLTVLFMFLWGAFEWIISSGEKEAVAGAQKKIINATIGLMLLAVSFAILKILGTFTGFTFFK